MNATTDRKLTNHEDVLEAIAETIDIPEHMEKKARDRYQAIGRWLDRNNSSIKQFDPEISPQGSFLLGTVIRPIGDADSYDIDLVCTLNGTKDVFSMAVLKKSVGTEIVDYANASSMNKAPEDGRRCWTLEYSDEADFHMDILPALPDEGGCRRMLERGGHTVLDGNQDIREKALAITDKTHPNYHGLCQNWPVSNPKGYAVWFQAQQQDVVAAHKRQIMKSETIYASVNDVPDHKVKTPLQRAIQLLKRHRDTSFNGDKDKPISIIITTLAAHAYSGEGTIGAALRTILKNMRMHIKERDGIKWVVNPVNPAENFADKWAEVPEKEEKFYQWMDKAQHDFGLYLTANAYDKLHGDFQEALSRGTVEKVLPLIALAAPAIISSPAAVSAEVEKIRNEGGATKPWCR